jgi:hypothetical protein
MDMEQLARLIDEESNRVEQLSKMASSAASIPNYNTSFNDLMKKVNQALKRQEAADKRFALMMLEMGWPPHGALYHDEINWILEAYDTQDKTDVKVGLDNFMISRYDADKLNEMLSTWKSNSLLQKRMKILEQVIESHINAKYFVSVPAILSQIEGILIDSNNYVGRSNRAVLEKCAKKVLTTRSFDAAVGSA